MSAIKANPGWTCFCEYFDAKFSANLIAWLAFLAGSIFYEFIVKTGNAANSNSYLSFQDLASKVSLTFVIISMFQFFLMLLLVVFFVVRKSLKTAKQLWEVEVSALTSISNYYFVTVGNYWIVRMMNSKSIQQGHIDPLEYFLYGFAALSLAAFCYWFVCNAGLMSSVLPNSGSQQPGP